MDLGLKWLTKGQMKHDREKCEVSPVDFFFTERCILGGTLHLIRAME